MLYLSAIVLSFFLSFVLLTKRNKSAADFILMAWLIVTGFHLLSFYLMFTGRHFEYPTLVSLGFPLPLAQGPFLYLYTRQQTSSRPFRAIQLLHFVPVLLVYLMFWRFYMMPFELKTEIFRQQGRGYELPMTINQYAIYISGVAYITLSLVRLLSYRKNMVQQFSNTEKINFNWLLYLIGWIVIIWCVVLFVQRDDMIFGAAALFVLWLGYFGIRQVQIFHHTPPVAAVNAGSIVAEPDKPVDEKNNSLLQAVETDAPKYQRSTLSEEDATLIHTRLKDLLEEQKPFTNPDLTLDDLAKTLAVHPNHLSQVINSRENKTFYDLVNEKRIEEFTRLIAQPSHQKYTLVSVAYDCGFNSKASFNRNFKKHMGVTPSEYLKSASQQVA